MSFNEWNDYILQDVCISIKTGKTPPAHIRKYLEKDEEGINFIGSKSVFDGYIDKESIINLNKDSEVYIKSNYVEEEDILLNVTGDGITFGRNAIVNSDILPAYTSQNIATIRVDKNKMNPKFIMYYLNLPSMKSYMNGFNSGSARRAISAKHIKSFNIKAPSIEEQKAIANVLSTLDDKIEVNNKINQKLEEMAQSIFKQWFIDFDFPNEEGKPYKSSGGEMVESELGMIPKGWEVKSIGELPITVTDYVANGSFKSLKENVTLYEEENYALFMRNTDLKCKFSSDKKFVDEHSYNFLDKSKLFGGEIIISNVGDVGSVYMCPLFDRPMTLGNNVIMINTKKNNIDLNKYLFRLFKSYLGQHLISSITGGSAQPKFNKTDFRNMKISMPKDDIINIYNEALEKVENKILKIDIENRKISTLRDTLIPKLMSGEIRVPTNG